MASEQVISGTVNLVRTLSRSYVKNGHLDIARELVEQLRIACDEIVAEINAAARQSR